MNFFFTFFCSQGCLESKLVGCHLGTLGQFKFTGEVFPLRDFFGGGYFFVLYPKRFVGQARGTGIRKSGNLILKLTSIHLLTASTNFGANGSESQGHESAEIN